MSDVDLCIYDEILLSITVCQMDLMYPSSRIIFQLESHTNKKKYLKQVTDGMSLGKCLTLCKY